MVGYDRPLDEYFAQVYNPAGEVILWVQGTTDLAELSREIEPHLDTEKLGLADISRAVFVERLREHLRPGSHPMHSVTDHRERQAKTIDRDVELRTIEVDEPAKKRALEMARMLERIRRPHVRKPPAGRDLSDIGDR